MHRNWGKAAGAGRKSPFFPASFRDAADDFPDIFYMILFHIFFNPLYHFNGSMRIGKIHRAYGNGGSVPERQSGRDGLLPYAERTGRHNNEK